ncbi:MAG: CRISPR-associated protein Csx16 [Arenicella sp.]|jgi:CRISPR-associated protein Csx16
MTTWIVTRHQGAKQWLGQQAIKSDFIVDDLNIDLPQAGDTIIGMLPIQHVATLNQRGVRYLHLCLQTPEPLRGHELVADQIAEFDGHLQEYQAITIQPGNTDVNIS